MSTKQFNLLNENKDSITDWESINEHYGPSRTEKIENPDGDQSVVAPTSIPSPFARIDLVRSAFNYVTKKNQLDGNTIYHRLISDCLDVAELFFNIDKLKDKVTLKEWDRTTDLDELLNSKNPKHRLYGETLQLYLEQDALSNNFSDIQRLHFVYYDNGIVGGTSPTTLFFTSANDLSFANIEHGNDTFFDKKLIPLYKREGAFQKYIHTLFRANPILIEKMKDFYEYIKQSYDKLKGEPLHNDIATIKNNDIRKSQESLNRDYDKLDTGIDDDDIEIIGVKLKKRKIANRKNVIASRSEFTINASKVIPEDSFPPLVLQNGFSTPLIYTDESVLWDRHWKVPYFDKKEINDRTLPGQLDEYPYLTVSDFLESYIIKLPFSLNDSKYFDGNVKYESGSENESYILPIRRTFFDYFTTKDLQTALPDGSPMCEMKVYANSVEVKLRVPIRGNYSSDYVTFVRTYQYEGITRNNPDLEQNKGSIIENKISLAIHPFVKTQISNPHYRVMLLDKDRGDTQRYKYDLKFYGDENSLSPITSSVKKRTQKDDDLIETTFYVLEENFDYIILKHNQANGVIIPKLKNETGTKRLKFAIDFGTTNTHIEYKIEDDGPYPFEIGPEDIQYEKLHTNFKKIETAEELLVDELDNINEYIRHELLPEYMGENSEFKFPLRTVTGESESLDYGTTPHALADINIPFDYEKYASKRNTTITTNLKWSDFNKGESNNKVRVVSFLEKIALLIRAKVLTNNGSLAKTEITWFYPSSMDIGKRGILEETWDTIAKEYIGIDKVLSLSESIAPFYFYKNHRNVSDAYKPVVSIDIGGGTNDIVVFKDGQPILSSSSMYAANSIFGDAYGAKPINNGFVQKYKQQFDDLISNNELYEIKRAVNQIYKKGKSEDIIALYFSLASNPKVVDKRIPLVFDKLLAEDEELKIVFLTFYSSIIYHVAKLMKQNKLEYPEEILFSGTGSKIIFITSGTKNLSKLHKLTTLIFSKVYDEDIQREIELKIEENPKEVTCKGGLEIKANEVADFENIKSVLIGDLNDSISSESNITYNTLGNEETLVQSIEQEHEKFIELLFSLHEKINFKNYFGINPRHFDMYKDTLTRDIRKYLNEGIKRKKASLYGDTGIKIEETLFFYPLVGSLNNLAYKIIANSKN
ncbi:acetate and sugar kinases/Hsc70/actin family protein [Kordia jejudonensis]|uniref:hypothetical protein n=1 Tax=Kordia jejudonensis TaxID=1348245 RepID=UPI0006290D60|nr:hypothetical protein [Kordia jejudonensis]